MKQLRLTTTTPYSMFSTEQGELIIDPKDIGEIIDIEEKKAKNVYIHGEAERLAGFDIPVIIDGDLNNLNLQVKEQDILMVLPSGEYKCKATIEQDLVHKAYYITLFDDWDSLKGY